MVGVRTQLHDVNHRSPHQDIAFFELHTIDAFVGDDYLRRVGTGIDNEVVFHGPLSRINFHVDAFVQAVVENGIVSAHARTPTTWVATDEVVFEAWGAVGAFDAAGATAFEPYAISMGTIITFTILGFPFTIPGYPWMSQVFVVGML